MMGTKANPGKHDCYAKADLDEPIFILRANDPTAPAVVRYWAMLNMGTQPKDKTEEALLISDDMRAWKNEKEKEKK